VTESFGHEPHDDTLLGHEPSLGLSSRGVRVEDKLRRKTQMQLAHARVTERSYEERAADALACLAAPGPISAQLETVCALAMSEGQPRRRRGPQAPEDQPDRH